MIVVLNNCSDASHLVVRAAAADLPGIALDPVEIEWPPEKAHVGSARRLGLDRALARTRGPQGVLLTTDADAVPDPHWVEANLAAIARGADLVGGHLHGDPDEEARLGPGFAARASAIAAYESLCDRYAALVDPLAHDPWPRHHNHTGASLAVRAELYRAVGGMPALPRREDIAFVNRVRAAGGKLVHPLDVRVMVSARLSGRAEGGMADCLKEWMRAEAEGAPILVRDPRAWRAFLLRRRAGRDADAARREDPCVPATDDLDLPQTTPVALATATLLEMIRAEEVKERAA